MWGYVAGAKFAQLDLAESQPGVRTLVVKRVLAPADAWLVVHTDDNGMPGKRVGYAPIAAGENRSVTVSLSPDVPLGDSVLVAVHADRGTLGKFEFNMKDKINSPNQPYFVDGKEVATKLSVK